MARMIRIYYIKMKQEELAKVMEFKGSEGHIDLQYMGVNSWTIKSLSCLGYQKLIHLNFSRNQLSNEGIQVLSKLPLANLRFLDIHWNNFDRQGIRSLIRGAFPSLQGLYLSGNHLGIEGVALLLLGMWNLRELGLTYAILTHDEQEKEMAEQRLMPLIRSRYPHLRTPLF